MSQLTVQQKCCCQCAGYDSSKGVNGFTGGCWYKPRDYFFGTACVAQVNDADAACDRFKQVELPF